MYPADARTILSTASTAAKRNSADRGNRLNFCFLPLYTKQSVESATLTKGAERSLSRASAHLRAYAPAAASPAAPSPRRGPQRYDPVRLPRSPARSSHRPAHCSAYSPRASDRTHFGAATRQPRNRSSYWTRQSRGRLRAYPACVVPALGSEETLRPQPRRRERKWWKAARTSSSAFDRPSPPF